MADVPTVRVAIVAGASSGIGRAAAVALAEAGYAVAVLARRGDLLQSLVDELDGEEALALPTDVTDAAAVDRAVEAVLAKWGRVDAVVNAAGDAPLQPIEKITPELWRQCVDSNLSSVIYMTRAVWPTMQKQKGGVVVNVSSMASIDPFRGFNIYAAAKAGVNMFTHCCADEGEKRGIRAVALAPGAVETAMLRRNFSEKVLPREKTLSPDEVAQVIVGCITGERAFTSGETIQVASP